MIVEEDLRIRRRMREDLEDVGFHVLSAATSVEALVIAADYPLPIDALVTDTGKRVYQNGLELAGCFRVLRPETAIILTGDEGPDRALEAPGSPEGGFIRIGSPYSQRRLIAALETALLGWTSAQAA